MRRSALIAITALVVGCNFAQEFQLPTSADAGDPGITPASGDAGCGGDSDPNNCGVCGRSCLGGACAAGKCAPLVLASGQGDSAYGAAWYPYNTDIGDALEGPDRIAVDDTHVYWLNLRGEVMRVPVSGGDAQRVAKTTVGPAWIVLDEQFVYFSTLGAEIFRVPKAGGSPARLAQAMIGSFGITLFSGPYPFEFMLSAGQLYWASGKGIYACPVSGCVGTPEVIDEATREYRPFSFAIDAAGTRYASVESHRSTGPSSETVDYAMTTFREGQWLGLASSTAYYELHGGAAEVYALAKTDFGPTGVVRWTESSVTFLASGDAVSGIPRGLALDDDFVYWSNAAANKIDGRQRTASVVRCKKTGCASPEVLAEGQRTPRAVAVSKGAVYWTTGDGNVMKLAKPEAAGQRPLK